MSHPIHATSLVPDHQTTSPHRRPLAPSRISTDMLCPRIRGDIRVRAGGSTGCGRLGACASSQRYPSLRGWCSAVGVIVVYLELWRPLEFFGGITSNPNSPLSHTSMIWNPRRRHHPVKLGDIYHGTYEKLGYGTYSTVWLARGHHRRLTKTNPAIFAWSHDACICGLLLFLVTIRMNKGNGRNIQAACLLKSFG